MFRFSSKAFSVSLTALACLPFGSIANAGIIEWVTVGDPGNTADTAPAGFGAVATSFQIMKYGSSAESVGENGA